MIIFHRTENIPQYSDIPYDDIKLEIGGGYETPIDDYIRYFVVFLRAIGFHEDNIHNILSGYIKEQEGLAE